MSRAAWAWTRHLHKRADRTLAPSTSAMEDLAAHRIPRVYKWARGVDITGSRHRPATNDCVGGGRRTASRSSGSSARLAPEKHVERLAVLAQRDDLQLVIVGDGVDRAKLETALALSHFHRSAVRRAAGDGVRQHGRVRPSRRARDVLPGRAGGDGVGPAGHRARRRRPARSRGPVCAPGCCSTSTISRPSSASPSTICSPNGTATRAAARRSVLGRTWPAVCDELFGHYEAVLGTRRRQSRLTQPCAILGDRLPLLPRLEPALVVGLGQLQRQLAEEHPQRRLRRRRRP